VSQEFSILLAVPVPWCLMTRRVTARSGGVPPPRWRATGQAILAIADAEDPPLRVFPGDQPLPLPRTEYARRIGEWEAWHDLSRQAFG
jgi:hypothetical protein